MKDTLLGFTTLCVLLSLVWIAHDRVTTSSSVLASNDTNTQKERANNKAISQDANDIKSPLTIDTFSCDYTQEFVDDMEFSEAFKLCRNCLGNDQIFTWNDNLFTTKVKEKEVNLVEKETTEPITPPETTITESVVSR